MAGVIVNHLCGENKMITVCEGGSYSQTLPKSPNSGGNVEKT